MTPAALVLKLGGAPGVEYGAALDDVAERVSAGERIVLVHGGSAEADRLGADVGHPARTLRSPSGHESRHTDPRTLELFVMATALVNRRIVSELCRRGVRAVGVSGADGMLLTGKRKTAIRDVSGDRVRVVRDDWSGRLEAADGSVLEALFAGGFVPVIAPVAGTSEGLGLNVDGDRAAAAIAGAIDASALVLLTDAPGLMRSFPDETTLIAAADVGAMEDLMTFAQGRMKRKVLAAQEALSGGVERVIIGSWRGERPVSGALAGRGTTIRNASRAAEVTA